MLWVSYLVQPPYVKPLLKAQCGTNEMIISAICKTTSLFSSTHIQERWPQAHTAARSELATCCEPTPPGCAEQRQGVMWGTWGCYHGAEVMVDTNRLSSRHVDSDGGMAQLTNNNSKKIPMYFFSFLIRRTVLRHFQVGYFQTQFHQFSAGGGWQFNA